MKRGISDAEWRIRKTLSDLSIPYMSDIAYCFICRNFFETKIGVYPNFCKICNNNFQKGDYCLPDFVIENDGKQGVLFVNGGVHTKRKNAIKDKDTYLKLRQAGIAVFVVWNFCVENAIESFLAGYLLSVYKATADSSMYERMYRNEKEVVVKV